MNISKTITLKTMLLFVVLVGCILIYNGWSSQPNRNAESLGNNFCPFGVCKGANPEVYYKDEDHRNLELNKPNAGSLPVEREMDLTGVLDPAYEYDQSWYEALYSDETGICAIRMFVSLRENKLKLLTKRVHEYLGPLKLGVASIKEIKGGKIYEWSGSALQKEPTFVSIIYTYKLGMPKEAGSWLEFKFNNFEECAKFEPSISPRSRWSDMLGFLF